MLVGDLPEDAIKAVLIADVCSNLTSTAAFAETKMLESLA